MIKNILQILLVVWLFSSCQETAKQEDELFIGRYRVMDRMIPYPYLILNSNDSLTLLDYNGAIVDKSDQDLQKDNTLSLGDKSLYIIEKAKEFMTVFDLNDTINFIPYEDGEPRPQFAARFDKVSSTEPIDMVQFKKDLAASIWEHELIKDENSHPNNDFRIVEQLRFNVDSVTVITNYFYQNHKAVAEYEVKGYSVFEVDESYFLSFHKSGDNPQPVYQIKKHDKDSIVLIDFSSRYIKDLSFKESLMSFQDFNNDLLYAAPFSNCYDGYQGEYYGNADVTYNKGNEYILGLVKENAPIVDDASGYIVIHFNVNCNSKLGNYGLIQMDRTYKETSFSTELVDHVVQKVSELTDFPSTESGPSWLYYRDVHAFLMFKIENGKITDLCP